jgi:hypothetical protein
MNHRAFTKKRYRKVKTINCLNSDLFDICRATPCQEIVPIHQKRPMSAMRMAQATKNIQIKRLNSTVYKTPIKPIMFNQKIAHSYLCKRKGRQILMSNAKEYIFKVQYLFERRRSISITPITSIMKERRFNDTEPNLEVQGLALRRSKYRIE